MSIPSRSDEKERSELKGGFRGIVDMNGDVLHYHYIKGYKKALPEQHSDNYYHELLSCQRS